MEGLPFPQVPPVPQTQFEPDTEKIKRYLISRGVDPTPKIVHNIRKKEIQKHNRKLNRLALKNPPLPQDQAQAQSQEAHFQALKREYRDFTRAGGRPWERDEPIGFRELASSSAEYGGEKREELNALREMFETRKREELKWVLDDDVEVKEDWFGGGDRVWDPTNRQRRRGDREVIEFLVHRLSGTDFSKRDWKLAKMMKQSGLQFREGQLLKVLGGLGARKCWKQALAVVEWAYKDKGNKLSKSRFVYTKLLAVLGKAQRPKEALDIFNMMLGDCHIYPDIAAYHSIAVTLGQSGHLKELLKIIECMRQKPLRKTMYRKNWDPILEPDVVVYNAILNACVQTQQWKSVSWVFNQLRKSGLKPNGATYGLAMEVMLESGKYDLVHELFTKMIKSGVARKAITYKVIVRALWCEGKVNEAVEAVRDMEQRGVVGNSGVYYELACCLCNNGRWQDALLQVEKMKKLSNTKPLEVTFTGMITSAMEGGHIDDCISIFEHMKKHCTPNTGTINAMLKVFGRSDMFSKAKELFEEIMTAKSKSEPSLGDGGSFPVHDEYTYTSMLKASASAQQWEYFEYIYKEMALSGYQLDQNRHASVLVEASRAGKGHLLEHAFDTTLEAGKIPHRLYFIEMVFQATGRQDYKIAATLVNTMAYAPFQVSERQWTNVVEKNEDRITKDGLEKLLDALHYCDVSSEATLVNLKRSLHSLCRSYTSRDVPNFESVPSQDDHADGFDVNEGMHTPNHFLENIQGHKSFTDPHDDSCDAPLSVSVAKRSTTARDVAAVIETVSMPFDYTSDEDELDTEFDEEIEVLINEVDSTGASDFPSAKEIMEGWKERRKKDGVPF